MEDDVSFAEYDYAWWEFMIVALGVFDIFLLSFYVAHRIWGI